MKNNNKLCLYVSYYLSRFNILGYNNLGYRNMNHAHTEIGRILVVKPATVKNMRDEFDPLHGFRAGWYQSPLGPSRVRIVEALQSLDEFQLRAIVMKILSEAHNMTDDIIDLISFMTNDDDQHDAPISRKNFIVRGPTGRSAEEFFIKHQSEFGLPITGILEDTREYGTDFTITNSESTYFIEVKGLADIVGGVLFTSKEWMMASAFRRKYILAVVSGLDSTPIIRFVVDPFLKLATTQNIVRSLQINWSVSPKELSKYL